MPYNGSGVFTPPGASYPPVVGEKITVAKFTAVIDDIASALSSVITKDGQTTATAAVPFAAGIQTDTIAEKTGAAGVAVSSRLSTTSGLVAGTYNATSNPAVKTKKLSITAPASSSSTTSATHDLTYSKIIGFQALIRDSSLSGYAPEYSFSSAYRYSVSFDSGEFYVSYGAGMDSGMLSKTCNIWITYEV